jgi:acetyl esterase
MTLHPESQKMLQELAALGLPPISEQSLLEARSRLGDPVGPLEEVAEATDSVIEGPAGSLRLRCYRPAERASGPLNLLVFFHGGGWVIGSIESHEDLARRLANACHAMVVSVDYRLAPESPYPAAVEDCMAATRWAVAQRADWGVAGLTIVSGDSAGGNLAAVVAREATLAGDLIVDYQVLLYPVTDSDLSSGSYTEFANGYGLTRDAMSWFWNQYTVGQDAAQPGASPLRADSLGGLPAAYVVTAEYDTLRDEGDAYARRLESEGVDVTSECAAGMLHGFLLHADRFTAVAEVLGRIGEQVRTRSR